MCIRNLDRYPQLQFMLITLTLCRLVRTTLANVT